MKTLKLILIPLFLSSTVFAQSEFETELNNQQSVDEQDLLNQQTNKKKYKEILETQTKRVQELKDKLTNLETYEKNFEQSKIITLTSVNEAIKTLPFLQKISSKAAFYKCLKKSIEENGYMTHDICNRNHFPKLSDEEKARVSAWKDAIGKSLDDVKKEKSVIAPDITSTEGSITTWEANLKWVAVAEERAKTRLETNAFKKEDLKFMTKHADIIRCDSSSPEINLEEEVPFKGADFKGAFFGVPRDNQDGVGTCFANTAKNLLVGVSEGKDIASFLDLALVYKNENKDIEEDGLNGGGSCPTLQAAAKVGYCPQQYAPLENGERNLAAEGLFKLDPYSSMIYIISMTKDFVNNLDEFEKDNEKISAEVQSRARDMIKSIKENPAIRIPLPIVRNKIPSDWKLKETFVLNQKSKILDPKLEQKDFIADYNEHYKSFYPRYIKDVLDGKNLDEIFKTYKASMAPFFEKYNLADSLPAFEANFKLNAEYDYKDKDLKKNIKASVDFLKKALNKKDATDADFYQFCSGSGSEFLRFMTAFQPLAEKLRTDKVNEEMLFDKNGELKTDAYELMQLTIAPSCLSKENRKALPAFTCDSGYDAINLIKKAGRPIEDQKRMLREKIVANLVQGYPLGNEHPSDGGGFHINTIVGIRFNPETKSCEFRIRESQTGTSGWHNENEIFKRIMALTEVRRKK